MPVLSLSRILAHWAAIQPERVAVDHEGHQITWADLDARTNRLARAWEVIGRREGPALYGSVTTETGPDLVPLKKQRSASQ